MRCRWRRDPAQRALLPRLRANLRAMAMLALILAGGCSPGGPAGPLLSCASSRHLRKYITGMLFRCSSVILIHCHAQLIAPP